MKKTDTKTAVVKMLADNQFHSGQQLGYTLGVSRAAIAKHIKHLQELGLDIHSVQGKGYRLSNPIQLLSQPRIASLCERQGQGNIEVLNIIDSTNDHLKAQIPELNMGDVCLAEAQTKGRGRHGRTWVSPYGASLYCSMYWRFEGGFQAVNGLSLVIGLAIVSALKELGISGVGLKWPNDVYCQGKKLAGVLIEAEGQMESDCHCVIGVGLNIGLPESVVAIDQPWIDLQQTGNEVPERNVLAAALVRQLRHHVQIFAEFGLAPFHVAWCELDIYRDSPVRLLLADRQILGVGKGIDETGGLLLDITYADGTVGQERFYGGEISVRPA